MSQSETERAQAGRSSEGRRRGRNAAAAKRKPSLNTCTHPRRTKTIPLPHEEAVFATLGDEWNAFIAPVPAAEIAAAEAPETAVHAVLPNEPANGPMEMTQVAVSDECCDDSSHADDERTQGRNGGVFPAHTGHEAPAEPDASKAEFATAEKCPPPRSLAEFLAELRIPEEHAADDVERALERARDAVQAVLPNEPANGPIEMTQVGRKHGSSEHGSRSAQERTQGQSEGTPDGVLVARTLREPGPEHTAMEGVPEHRPRWTVPSIPNDVIGREDWDEILRGYQAMLRRDLL